MPIVGTPGKNITSLDNV